MTNLLKAAWAIRQAVRRAVSRSVLHKPWSGRRYEQAMADRFAFDIPVAIAVQVARNSSSIVEVGAADGGRILAIKDALPAISATGMDIGTNYGDQRLEGGVTFRRYNPEAITPGSIVFSHGTLSYFSPDEVERLFAAAATLNCSILIFEPALPFKTDRPYGRAGDCWYHPFDAIAAKHGLRDVIRDEQRWKQTGSLKNIEQWQYALFKPSQK